MKKRMLDQQTLDDIIRRIVEVAQPEKIILFGSAARGEMTRHSDVDLLIIKEGTHRRSLAGRIYENLYGVGAAVDVVVVTPADVERYKDSHALIIKSALREGRAVYESGVSASCPTTRGNGWRSACDSQRMQAPRRGGLPDCRRFQARGAGEVDSARVSEYAAVATGCTQPSEGGTRRGTAAA